jgi:glycosyltransferase involved in cell wall biosynthesis
MDDVNRSAPERIPRVDVVIPTRGRGALIDVTIASIRQSAEKDFALWVVDQSDDDLTRQAVLKHAAADPRVRYLHAAPRGSDFARNIGIAAGRAPYVVFTDDDCRVATDWLRALTVELADPGTWAVFGRVIPDEDYRPVLQLGGGPVSASLPVALKDDPERRVFHGNRFDLGFGHGANMGFRRERLAQVGGFDNLLGAGAVFRSWPERDIGYRILRRGGRVIYTPDALVHHRHWRGWEEIRRTYRNYGIGAGAAVGKYVRCGDRAAWYLLFEWIFDQGVRQVLSGVLKWRSWQKTQVGLLQLVYPWAGLARSWRQPVDREKILYVDRS